MPRTKKKAPPKIAGVAVASKPRKKNPPRTAFRKGGPNPHAFVAGTGSPNPGGKVKSDTRLISKALLVALANRAPDEAAKALNLPKGSSWAQCLGQRLIHMALRGDLAAMDQIRQFTEGNRIHASVDFQDPGAAPPIIEIVFVDAVDGRPAPGTTIDAQTAVPPALPLPAPED
jgi:hypothetical protein